MKKKENGEVEFTVGDIVGGFIAPTFTLWAMMLKAVRWEDEHNKRAKEQSQQMRQKK